MNNRYEKMSLFEQLQAGLEDSIAFSKGHISLRTTDLPPQPPKASKKTVINLRKQLRMSQAVFAATLNVSPKTVQSWEQGTRNPSHAALRILQVISKHPEVVNVIFDEDQSRNAGTENGSRSRVPQPAQNRRHTGSLTRKKKG